MALHLYPVGTVVFLQYTDGNALARSMPFTVEAQLPPVGTSVQYRIKSENEAFRRVVPEHQVSPTDGRIAAAVAPAPAPAFSNEQE